MRHCLGMDDEPAENLMVRITLQSNNTLTSVTVLGVCCSLSDLEEAEENFCIACGGPHGRL